MAINFPTSLDVFTDPSASDQLNLPSHSGQHTDLNNAVEALEAKVGADSSAVTSSLDYKIAQLEARTSGKILQVVSSTYSTAETTTSGTLVDTSLTASITPSSASNKVLVMIASPLNVNNTGSTTNSGEGRVGIKRDSTDVYSINYHMHYFDSAGSTDRGMSANGTITYMDSPATTSATTYTFRFAASSCTMTAQYQNQVSTIVLMEVAA